MQRRGTLSGFEMVAHGNCAPRDGRRFALESGGALMTASETANCLRRLALLDREVVEAKRMFDALRAERNQVTASPHDRCLNKVRAAHDTVCADCPRRHVA
jgi:hypothetical protein